MSWSNILNILNGKAVPTLTHKIPLIGVTPAPMSPAYEVKMISIEEMQGMLDISKRINASLLREGCRICNVHFVGGGIIFCQLSPFPSIELENLREALCEMLSPGVPYIFTYVKEERNHPTLAYYTVIGIRSDNVLDLKKALKIHKLKAFI